MWKTLFSNVIYKKIIGIFLTTSIYKDTSFQNVMPLVSQHFEFNCVYTEFNFVLKVWKTVNLL